MSSPVLLLNLIACLWCSLVLNVRFQLAGNSFYVFMLWNLFLAAIPLGLSLRLQKIRHPWVAVPVLGAWLLFFPNAPYVLTDLLHLNEKNEHVPKWLDLLMLLSFGLVSLWLGFQSLRLVQHWIARRYSAWAGWCVAIGSLGLSGFGIYLGRFLRWNSWDIVRRPLHLLGDIAERFLYPQAHASTWHFTLGYGVLLTLAYLFWVFGAQGLREKTGSLNEDAI